MLIQRTLDNVALEVQRLYFDRLKDPGSSRTQVPYKTDYSFYSLTDSQGMEKTILEKSMQPNHHHPLFRVGQGPFNPHPSTH